MTGSTRRIPLSDAVRRRLEAEIDAEGSFPDFVRGLQARLVDGSLEVDDGLIEEIEHLAYDLGRGRWQLLLREILEDIESSHGST